MSAPQYVSADFIRSAFSQAMSEMYRCEVPAYGALLDLVEAVNREKLNQDTELGEQLKAAGSLERISAERHGAIRLGTARELATMRRVFAVMGMHPVGYYDLSGSGVPVHSTAFRPVDSRALQINPFRIFTSLLRLDLIADSSLRQQASDVLAQRDIFSERLLDLVSSAEREGGLSATDAEHFVAGVLNIFRWHQRAIVSADLYQKLHASHPLLADVVSFKGPHINHLTPRTLDIDQVQTRMPDHGIHPKAFVEGPPARTCPILLRQTSFKALEESVAFQADHGEWQPGVHAARFGEVEQRGIALTPRGRTLYDELLARTRTAVRPASDGSNVEEYRKALQASFNDFPDTWEGIRAEGLGYFSYTLTQEEHVSRDPANFDAEALLSTGALRYDPIVYEDFLPVSAAGIFQSNLGNKARQVLSASPNQLSFETDLGAPVLNEFEHYAQMEAESLKRCKALLFERQNDAQRNGLLSTTRH